MEIAEQKAARRRALRADARRHSPEECASDSRRICELIRTQQVWTAARAVLFYRAFPSEPDLSPLIHEAFSAGKTVCFPRYSAELQLYQACQVRHLSTEMAPGAFGVVEPVADCPVFQPNGLDFLLIPGIGFTLTGRRLGRGKGHYDRLLARTTGATCGVAFEWQIVAELPVERHDVVLDFVVTPRRWQTVAAAANVR